MRVSLGLLGAAAFIVVADVRVIDPLLHIIADEFGTGVGSAAIIVTAYTIPYGLFQLVYGPLGDSVGKLRVMTVAMAAFAIGTAGCALVPTIELLSLLRFLTGMVAAAIIPLSLAYIGDHFPYEKRQAAIGRYLSAVMLGQILSTSLGGVFGEYLSWRGIFLVFGVVSLGVSIAMWRVTRIAHRQESTTTSRMSLSTFKPYYQLMNQQAAPVIIAVFVEGFFLLGGLAYFGAFLRAQYQLPYVAIGFMLSSFGVGGLIYSASVKWLLRRLGENGLIGVGGWLVCACFLAIAVFHSWVLFIPLTILMGIGFYMLHNTLQTQATELAPESRGAAVSLFVFSLFIGQGIGAAVFGRVVDSFGYIPCFVVAGITIALLAVWLVKQLRLKHQ